MSGEPAFQRTPWYAPAWLCPDLQGIADPGQPESWRGIGHVELHREQYVSREDAVRMRHFMHWIPAGHGWTTADKEENHPGDILREVAPWYPRRDRHRGRIPNGVEWPEGVVGLLVTPVGKRLDRGRLDHPKKRLRERPTRILTSARGWRGLIGDDSDLLVVVRRRPRGAGFGLHRIARTVRRDGGASQAHLLLSLDTSTDGQIPVEDDLDRFAQQNSGRFTRLVELTTHVSGSPVVTGGPDALPAEFAVKATAYFPDVMQVSVREGLLDGGPDVDRIAAEVSELLLEAIDVALRKED